MDRVGTTGRRAVRVAGWTGFTMLAAHRRFLVFEQALASGVFNLLLNGALAFVMFRHLARVPLCAFVGIATDTLSTSFMLPLTTCLAVTLTVRRAVRRGRVPPLGWTRASHPALFALGAMPLWHRAVALAAVCAGLCTPLAIVPFVIAHTNALPLHAFIGFKAAFASLLAAVVTPMCALWALADRPGGARIGRVAA